MSQINLKKSKVENIIIDADQAGRRIDNFLLSRLQKMPKSRIYQMLRRGEVRVNASRVKPDYRLQTADEIRIPPVFEQKTGTGHAPPVDMVDMIKKCVLHEDERLLVINKPAGLPAHAGTGSLFGVIELLREAYRDEDSMHLIHRLDKETSGCLLVAKKMPVLRRINLSLKSGKVRKEYDALLHGQLRKSLIKVDSPLQRYRSYYGEGKVRPDEYGKTALSEFEAVGFFRDATRVKVRTGTGRTHQIRVHADFIGHPLAGDKKYGDREFNRQLRALGLKRMFLHASKISVPVLQASGAYQFSAPLPSDLEGLLAHLTVSSRPSRPSYP